MAKVILICGKICSGKTTYARRLVKERGGVILSSDELMLAIFDPLLGDKHDEIAARANAYLFRLALKMIEAGTDVILDWGFWTRDGRRAAEEFFAERGLCVEWHYVQTAEAQWKRNIEKRNKEVLEGKTEAYFVDEGLLKKLEGRFEAPEADEIAGMVQTHSVRDMQNRC